MHYHNLIADLFSNASGLPLVDVFELIEFPPQEDQGDRAIPVFRFSKERKKSPQDLAKEWAAAINSQKLPSEISKVEALGGYVNFYFDTPKFAQAITKEIFNNKSFGKIDQHDPETVIVEYSSPNIAKPFSIGHLRSTNIGASIARIMEYRGHNVIRINHLGDWGTQFGKLIVAYKKWGNEATLKNDPIQELFKLYVKFHDEEGKDPSLSNQAREAFTKLEQGDLEAKKLWDTFKQFTLDELSTLYKRLGVKFDHYWGESFYVEHMPKLLKLLETEGFSKHSEGATIVDLKEEGLGVALLQKGDESSLYLTRDLAAAIYRHEKFNFDQMIYVVGAEQRLHFQQLFKILDMIGHTWSKNCEHVAFGSISFGDEKMSTRKGNVVFLADVLQKAKDEALRIVNEKNSDLENKEEAAEKIALGAVLFADISAKRIKNVKFSWEEILSFDGETGPYLQYSLVRTKSLMNKFGKNVEMISDFSIFKEKEEHNLVRALSLFPIFLERAEREREPFVVGQYLINLTKSFNRFYNAHRILDGDAASINARMLLVKCTSDVLTQGLNLIGIPTLERM
ncbi:MAG: arginine--tRNA ligase [Bdellovibrionota bacterium]